MPIHFPCPDCGETVAVSDHLAGLHTACSHCKVRILVPSGAPAPEHVTAAPPPGPLPEKTPPVSDKLTTAAAPAGLSDLPRHAGDTAAPHGFFPPDAYTRRRPSGSGEGWGPVRVGLLLLQIGLGLVAGATVVYLLALAGLCIVGGVPAPRDFIQGDGPLLLVIGALLALGLVLLAVLSFLVGEAMCCAVPRRSGTRGMIVAALVCSLIGHALSVVSSLTPAFSGAQRRAQFLEPLPFGRDGAPWEGRQEVTVDLASGAFALVSMIFGVVSHFLLAGFLQGLARYFGDPRLLERAGDYLANLGKFVAAVVILLVMTCVPILGVLGAIALLAVLLIYGIVLFVKLFNLLAEARRTVIQGMVQR